MIVSDAAVTMTPALSTGLLIALLIVLTAVMLTVQRKRAEKAFRKRLLSTFGEERELRLTAEEYESIRAFARDHESNGFFVDDTTWHDLGMDEVFLRMDSCMSSPGEDVLMYWLRVQKEDGPELRKRRESAAYYDSHAEERADIQMILHGVGRKLHQSQYAYIRSLDSAKPVRLGLYLFLTAAAVLSIILLFIEPLIGLAVFVPLLIADIFLQMRGDRMLRLNVEAFNSILRLMHAGKRLMKMDPAPFADDIEAIRKDCAALRSFARGSYFVTSAGKIGTGIEDAILSYLKMFFHPDMLKFNQMLSSYRSNAAIVSDLYRRIGYIDAVIASASFRRRLPWSADVDTEDTPEACFAAEKLFHPLIGDPVPNDVALTGGNLVTGSNASGKSTFLKSCGIASILAQGLGYTCAASYRAPFLRVMSSMALEDNLAGGESYFIVELKSIQRILSEAKKPGCLLCLVDEVLRGTNTIERIAASSRILRSLCGRNVIALAATHDIELTQILREYWKNWHFTETVTDEDVSFDYKLREGPATTRNAIRLLRMLGFEKELADSAQAAADHFEENGIWEAIHE